MMSSEVERALLAALETLQSEQPKQHTALQSEQKKQQELFTATVNGLLERLERLSAQNKLLGEQVASLSEAVQILRKKLRV